MTSISISDLMYRHLDNLARGQRQGQAFFNALPKEFSDQFLYSPSDPYQIDDPSEMELWMERHLVWSDDGRRVVGVKL